MADADELWPPFRAAHAAAGDRRAARESGGQGARAGRGQPVRGTPGRGQPGRGTSGRGQASAGQAGAGPHGRNRARPALTRADIVDAAIAIADSEGPDAVSMRKIAQVLRAGTMSLYWYVANKEHLLDLVLDALVGEIPLPDSSGDWRAYLQAMARGHRAMLLRHRWVMDFIGGRPSLGPNTLLNLEASLAALDDLGLDLSTSFDILSTVLTYVLGAVLRELQELRDQRDHEQWDVSPAQWRDMMSQWRANLQRDGRFRHFIQFIDEGFDPDAPETRDARFEFGLDCVLDGLSAQIARRADASPGARQP